MKDTALRSGGTPCQKFKNRGFVVSLYDEVIEYIRRVLIGEVIEARRYLKRNLPRSAVQTIALDCYCCCNSNGDDSHRLRRETMQRGRAEWTSHERRFVDLDLGTAASQAAYFFLSFHPSSFLAARCPAWRHPLSPSPSRRPSWAWLASR